MPYQVSTTIILFYMGNITERLSYLFEDTEGRIMKIEDLEQCPGESRLVLYARMGVLQFYLGKADFCVSEKLPHTVKNSLFPDFRAFCCRYCVCRILMEATYGQRETYNVCNLKGSLSFFEHTILSIKEIKETLVRNIFSLQYQG